MQKLLHNLLFTSSFECFIFVCTFLTNVFFYFYQYILILYYYLILLVCLIFNDILLVWIVLSCDRSHDFSPLVYLPNILQPNHAGWNDIARSYWLMKVSIIMNAQP